MDEFKFRLAILMKEHHYTNEKLSWELDLVPSTVSSYRRGKTLPDLETFFKICAILDTSADYLLGRTTKKSGRKKSL